METHSRATWLWVMGRLAELRILGLVGANRELGSRFWVDFRDVVLHGTAPTKEEAMPILELETGELAEKMWLLICSSVDNERELFELANRLNNRNPE